MSRRVGRVALSLGVVAALTWLAAPGEASGHRLDEYMQATLVGIEPGEVRLRMTLMPGVAVAAAVLANIDRDQDGTISEDEAKAYVQRLEQEMHVRLDDRPMELKVIGSDFPPPAELREGGGLIEVEFAGSVGALTAGAHKLVVENLHLPAVSVYLLNALLPASPSVRVIQQTRSENQSKGEIEFSLAAGVDEKPKARGAGERAGAAMIAVTAAAAAAVGLLRWRRGR